MNNVYKIKKNESYLKETRNYTEKSDSFISS